ncbi:unnamed protein product [Timema podura]|uniref:Essential protein Yae1 N-terminal domain-containing protein n=1 Tax=Timema podura TaxID=61482 RepID=A0ABN7PTD4_TIMPD|nr:unnamed protein product [Timema podura]
MESIVDQNEPEEEDISSYTWEVMSRTMKKTGFREGASAGWDLTFQEGFNKGYIEGFDAGFSLGYLKGIVWYVPID